jgi:hypothetical protein
MHRSALKELMSTAALMSSSSHPSVVDFVLEALDAVCEVSRIDSSNSIGGGRRSERRRRMRRWMRRIVR